MAEESIRLLPIAHQHDTHQEPSFDEDGITSPSTTPPVPSNDHATSIIEDGEGEEEDENKSFFLGQKMTFIGIAMTNVIVSMSLSVIAPFFPYEAEKKGASKTETGLVFALFALVSFIASPFWGKYLPVIGAKFTYLSGIFVAGGCNILFGFLDQIEGKTTFLVYCFVIRTVEGLGSAASLTAGLAITANVFPNNVAHMSSILEIFVGIGFAAGPPVGSLFYGIGGYKSPFIAVGCIAMTVTIFNMFIIPSLSLSKEEDQKPGSLIEILKIPAIGILFISFLWGVSCLSFLETSLGLFLISPPLNVPPYQTGLYFLILGGMYALLAPVWGYVADKKKTTRFMIGVGIFLQAVSLMFLGPSPILHIHIHDTGGRLGLIIFALVLMGVGISFFLIQIFLDLLTTATHYGLPDNLSTQALASGLYFSAFSLGNCTGPIVGGALVTRFGFEWAATYIALGCFITFTIICLFSAWEFQCGKGRRKPNHSTDSS